MRIAVDAMGGDQAPDEIVLGVAEAIQQGFVTPQELVLVGPEERIRSYHRETPVLRDVQICNATQVVEMSESPTGALRSKPDSSIFVAMKLVKSGEAQAFVSAGNTGAVVAHAMTILGRLPGVKRPGIAVTVHGRAGPVTLVDVGANVHCKPQHLYDYGVMASIYSRDVLGIDTPKVGLLNIGEEKGKGNDLVRETSELLASDRHQLNFVGNVEGNDLYSGRCHVVVCEGFVGNVALKVSEGIGAMVVDALQEVMQGAGDSETGRGLRQVFRKLDYASYGGAPLLGVDGQVTIMHGRSSRKATANALRVAHQSMQSGMTEHIRRAMREVDDDATA